MLLTAALLSRGLSSGPEDERPWIGWIDPTAHSSLDITKETAERHILAYLAGFTRTRRLPEELTIFGCETRCNRAVQITSDYFSVEPLDDDVPCPNWMCTLMYGDNRRYEMVVFFKVEIGSGGQWFTGDLEITRCLARRHGCRLHRPEVVERQLTRPRIWEPEVMWFLVWNPLKGQFVWEYGNDERPRRLPAHRGH